jgi:hypothetical protein
MDSASFDDLTKALATATSRRQALKTIVATTLGGLLGLGGIDAAFAAKKCRGLGSKCSHGDQCCSNYCANNVCTCSPGQTNCNGTCVDLQTNNNNCGTCGNVCPSGATCSGGQCLCPPGLTNCNGTCVDLQTDQNNCGFCGNMCTGVEECFEGFCI